MDKKEINRMLEDFFKNLKSKGADLTKEDLDTAIDSFKQFTSVVAKLEEQEKTEKTENEKKENPVAVTEPDTEADDGDGSLTMLDLDWDAMLSDEAEDGDEAERAENAHDGYLMCLNRFGRINLEYISEITGLEAGEVISQLRGVIYQNPDTWGEDPLAGWESADEYLSGNILQKWKSAKTANRVYRDVFRENVRALNRLLPEPVDGDGIYVTLGSPWVPPHVIDEFIYYMAGASMPKRIPSEYRVNHVEELGIWELPSKNRFNYTRSSVRINSVYGTARMSALYILENTLNMKTIAIYDTVKSRTGKGGDSRVLNENETVLAVEKQEKMIREFQKWVFSDDKRKEELYKIYENLYGCVIKRQFDGSFLRLPGMSNKIQLYPYQKNAVARIISTPNTLLAHDVGSGKTYTMIVAGMEMKRMKISEKNMYVVPNNLTGQWKSMFEELYPGSNVLCIEPKSFTPNLRADALEKIKAGGYDAVIIAYSCFELIPMSFTHYVDSLWEIEEYLTGLRDSVQSKSIIDRKLKKAYSDFEKLKKKALDSGIPGFDELGVNTLFVDEAHNFKNVPVDTKITRVLGISNTGSAKCKEMMEKAMCVQKQNGGRGVVLATGTPITNSITEAYVMQKYLQSGELAILGL